VTDIGLVQVLSVGCCFLQVLVPAHVVLEVVAQLDRELLLLFVDEVVGEARIHVEPEVEALEAIASCRDGEKRRQVGPDETVVADLPLVVLDGRLHALVRL